MHVFLSFPFVLCCLADSSWFLGNSIQKFTTPKNTMLTRKGKEYDEIMSIIAAGREEEREKRIRRKLSVWYWLCRRTVYSTKLLGHLKVQLTRLRKPSSPIRIKTQPNHTTALSVWICAGEQTGTEVAGLSLLDGLQGLSRETES